MRERVRQQLKRDRENMLKEEALRNWDCKEDDLKVNLSKLANLLSLDHEKPSNRELFIQKMLSNDDIVMPQDVKFEQ